MTISPATLRHAVQHLVAGEHPPTADYGDWAGLIDQLTATLEHDGISAVQDALSIAARADRGLAAMLADLPRPTETLIIPGLPDPVLSIIAETTPCAGWLDDYIDFANEAAPATPAAFHEAAGLWLAATAIARRLQLQLGAATFYPNIYTLFIAPPGRYTKSTALSICRNVLRGAGLEHLLLPEKMTPESFLRQLSHYIPDYVLGMHEEQHNEWLRQRAQSAQRGMLLDEAAYLFADLKKEYMSAMLDMLLQLYDGPHKMVRETITNGQTVVTEALLSFLGVTNPKAMEAHLQNERLWDEGLWSRFALISPDTDPVFVQFGEHILHTPASLLHGLNRIDRLFVRPTAQIIKKNKDENQNFDVLQVTPLVVASASLTPDARLAWNIYDRAVRYDIPNGGLEESLHASYSRFPTQVLKVSMILATMDAAQTPVLIEIRHLARAIRIVEGWRCNLHRLWREGLQSSETKQANRLLGILRESILSGATIRSLCQKTGYKSKDVKDVLEMLRLAGQAEMAEHKAANGRLIQTWKAA